MKIFLSIVFLILLMANKTYAQKDKADFLNKIVASLPVAYIKSNNNTYFSIQLGAFSKENEELSMVKHISIMLESDNLYKYRIGEFTTFKQATEFKQIIQSVFKDAFVIPLKNGIRIPLTASLKEM